MKDGKRAIYGWPGFATFIFINIFYLEHVPNLFISTDQIKQDFQMAQSVRTPMYQKIVLDLFFFVHEG